MINEQSFYGVVVLYEPQSSVIENIRTYIGSVKKLFIYDNSSLSNEIIFIELKHEYEIEYIFNGVNDGISESLNNVAKKLYGLSDAWLLTMDQDSYFKELELQKMLDFLIEKKESVALISPFHKTMAHKEKPNISIEERLTVMTSGNLLNISIHEKVGGFDERYFIDCVDLEYCLRLNALGYSVLRLNDIELEHVLGEPFICKKIISKKDLIISNHNYIRRYYITRNKLLISTQYFSKYPKLCLIYLYSLFIIDLKNIIFYEGNKLLKLKSFMRGIIDFCLNKFGGSLKFK